MKIDVEAARRDILTAALAADGGWEGDAANRAGRPSSVWRLRIAAATQRTPEHSARLTITESIDGPSYHLEANPVGWNTYAFATCDARHALDILATIGVVNPPAPLLAQDVAARIDRLAAQRAREQATAAPPPISIRTVYDLADKARRGLRYPGFPQPSYVGERHRSRPFWHVMDGPAIDWWWANRPGHGVGGGRPRKAATEVTKS